MLVHVCLEGDAAVGDMYMLFMLFSRSRRDKKILAQNIKRKVMVGVTHARDFDSFDLRTQKRTVLCFGS